MSAKQRPIAGGGKGMSGRQTYNVVTDTVGGVPNFRLRDNLIQGVVVVVATLFGTLAGYFLGSEPWVGMLLGAGAGLVGGTLISGVFLMIYRAVKHARGRHD